MNKMPVDWFRFRRLFDVGLLAVALASSIAAVSHANLFCDDCDPCCDTGEWCATCCRVCEEKTTRKWIYGCKEKLFCKAPCPHLGEPEECLECESRPRVKRVLMKKQIKETKPHMKCELVRPAKPAPVEQLLPAEPIPPVPPAELPPKTARRSGEVTRTSARSTPR